MRAQNLSRMTTVFACVILTGACQTAFQGHEKKIVIAPDVMQGFLNDKPEPTHRLYRNVLSHGERNSVLNHLRAGLAAMELRELDVAEESFNLAVTNIEKIYSDNEKAEKARSNFIKENIKDFKGEGYERAMAFYYRGLLHLMRGDYGNAQASFGSGLLQDTYAEDERYAQDFASLAFLRGWAYRCQGSEVASSASFSEAFQLHKQRLVQEERPTKLQLSDLKAPKLGHNVILVGESGSAPRKMATGEYKEKLTYRRGPAQNVDKIVFTGGEQSVVATPFEDIFWQASTRGGRAVDHIMEGKAQFKGTTDTVGNVMLSAGAATTMYGAYSQNNNAAIAGGIMMLGGLIAKGISAATRPDADLRQWDNLPEHIHLSTMNLPSTTETLDVSFLNALGKPSEVGDKGDKTVTVSWAGECGIAWVRSVSALDVPDEAPESAAPGYIVATNNNISDEQESE